MSFQGKVFSPLRVLSLIAKKNLRVHLNGILKTNSLDFKRKTLRAAKLPEKQNVKEREKKAMFYEAA